jgi:DNA-binding NarL/FixJ family response regulator
MTELSSNQGPRRILLVGHCGPDSTYLRSAVRSALGDVQIVMVDDNAQLQQALAGGADLVLLNRDLGYGLEPASGVEMIATLRQQLPALRMMLVSNYPDAQAAAVAAGALAGFGKRQIGTPRVGQVLRDALSQAKS